MLRTPPPLGRVASLVLLAVLTLIVLPAAPATAAGELSLSVSERVTGRDPLILTFTQVSKPVALHVEITDADGAVGAWRYPAVVVAEDARLPVDLSAPDSGAAPRNGPAEVTVTLPAGPAITASTIIDRAPPAPTLRSVVRGQRVGLTWDAVAAADTVTYRLERIATGEAWTVVQESNSASGYTDRGLEPGRYRYRLSAAVPSAEGDENWSELSAVQVRIAAPAPTAAPTPTQPAQPRPTREPVAQKPAPAGTPPNDATDERERERDRRPRPVAATGTVRSPVPQPDGGGPELPANPTPLLVTADEPAVNGAAPPPPSGEPAVAAPQVAPPAPSTPAPPPPSAAIAPTAPRAPLQPFPVTVPPGGALAVQAATQLPPDLVTLLAGVVFLLLGAGVAQRVRGRAGLWVSQVRVGRR